MKKLAFLPLLFAVMLVHATNFYVSSTGNDANNGTSPATAWRTLGKVNSSFASINPGDSILLRRGDLFFGTMVIGKSGTSSARIVVGAYGTGAKPVISGFVNLGGWTSSGANIWSASVPTAKTSLNLVTVNGRLQPMGRFPNSTAPSSGYLYYESSTFNTTSGSITDNQLTTLSSTNWTGAEVVIRKEAWILDRCRITAQSGNTISHINPPGLYSNYYRSLTGFGYFIQNDIRTLDTEGEWFYNGTSKTLSFFSNTDPSTRQIRMAVFDTLVNTSNRTNITIENLGLEGGHQYAVFNSGGSNVTVQNCDIRYVSYVGIDLTGSGFLVRNNLIRDCLNNGIDVDGGVSIVSNTVKNCGMFPGMGFDGDNQYCGMALGGANQTIQGNRVDSIGYNGIKIDGDNIVVRNNFVKSFCNVKNDGGGIYTWDNFGRNTRSNRLIVGNIVMDAPGVKDGTPASYSDDDVRGIYLDGGANNVRVEDNSVANIGGGGLFYNNTLNVVTTGNTVYNTSEAISFQRFPNLGPLIRNMTVRRNIFFPLTQSQNAFFYWNGSLNDPAPTTIEADIRAFGTFDSNYYRNDVADPFDWFYHTLNYGGWVDPPSQQFEQWQESMSFDRNSRIVPLPLPDYNITNVLSKNSISNGGFTTSLAGVSITASNGAFNASWDNSGSIDGSPCLRITPTASSTVFTNITAPVGNVISSKKYLLRFFTIGGAAKGTLRASIRSANSPFASLVSAQTRNFGRIKTMHEFLFSAPSQSVAASYLIEIQQSSGTTFIDNIEFFEVTSTSNTRESQARFEYNATDVPLSIDLGARYVGVDNQVFDGRITLAPFTSKVLIRSSGYVDVDAGNDIVVTLPVDSTTVSAVTTGFVTSYRWTKIAGPSQFIIAAPNAPTTVIKGLVSGSYAFRIEVIDARGNSASDTVIINSSIVLPVTLVEFTARKDRDSRNLVGWKTANEENCSHFAIERSSDGRQFNEIGRISAVNQLNLVNVYNFTDNQPLFGANYYRLKIVDRDGSFKYSSIILVERKTQGNIIIDNLALNSQSGTMILGLTTDRAQRVTYSIVSPNGIVLGNYQAQLQSGYNKFINQMQLSGGLYYLKINASENTIIRAVMAQ